LLLLSISGLGGCLASNVDLSFDGDADGLLDAEEEKLGTDPEVADSDGDGFVDGEESSQYTDPLNPGDHPYTGGWDIDACRATVTSTGNAQGEIAHTFEAGDQFGDTVKLHDFCGKAVVLASGAFW